MKKKKTTAFECVLACILIFFVSYLLFLLTWGILTSLKTYDDVLYNPLKLPTEGWMFSNYSYIMTHFQVSVTDVYGAVKTVGMLSVLLNTGIYAVLGSFVAASIPLLVGYMCARFTDFKLSKILYTVVIIVMILPIVGTYPAHVKLLKSLYLYDTFYGVILHQISFTNTYFLVYFTMVKGVDKSYSEAAYMDGAGEFSILFRIYLPLLKTTFFTVMLLMFVARWNDYNTPLLYMPSHPTLSYAIFQMSRSALPKLSQPQMRMTAGVILVIPIIVLFVIFREKLTGNLTIGGVKG